DLQSDPVDRLGIPPTRNRQFLHTINDRVNQRFQSGAYDSRNRAETMGFLLLSSRIGSRKLII
ncbi:MAG: hypothetical protein QMB52_10675, partial [Propionivibrio sp.]